MPKLRGHHLICLHFFEGDGYDTGFVENLGRVLKTAENSPVYIIHGIDDVCEKCPHMKDRSCRYSKHSDAEIREMDKKALDLLGAAKHAEIAWVEIKERMPGIFRLWHESYCIACGWKMSCEKNVSYRKLSNAIASSA